MATSEIPGETSEVKLVNSMLTMFSPDSNIVKGFDFFTKAVEEDKNKNYEEAFGLYVHGVEHFVQLMILEIRTNRAIKTIRAKCVMYLKRAELIKRYLANNRQTINEEQSRSRQDSDVGNKGKTENGDGRVAEAEINISGDNHDKVQLITEAEGEEGSDRAKESIRVNCVENVGLIKKVKQSLLDNRSKALEKHNPSWHDSGSETKQKKENDSKRTLKNDCKEDNDKENALSKDEGVRVLLKSFPKLFLSGWQSDIQIKVGEQKFHAHKNILSSRSTVFRVIFQSQRMAEDEESVLEVNDCAEDTFMDFLLFLYTGNCDNLSSNNAISLYKTADKYDIEQLKLDCRYCLLNDIPVEVVLDALIFAHLYDDTEVRKKAVQVFLNNIEQLLLTEKWKKLKSENVYLLHSLLQFIIFQRHYRRKQRTICSIS